MRRLITRVAAVAVIAVSMFGVGASHADASPGKICARVGVYIYPVDEIVQCVPTWMNP